MALQDPPLLSDLPVCFSMAFDCIVLRCMLALRRVFVPLYADWGLRLLCAGLDCIILPDTQHNYDDVSTLIDRVDSRSLKLITWGIVLFSCRVATTFIITVSLRNLVPRHLPSCGLHCSAYAYRACSTVLVVPLVENAMIPRHNQARSVPSSDMSVAPMGDTSVVDTKTEPAERKHITDPTLPIYK